MRAAPAEVRFLFIFAPVQQKKWVNFQFGDTAKVWNIHLTAECKVRLIKSGLNTPAAQWLLPQGSEWGWKPTLSDGGNSALWLQSFCQLHWHKASLHSFSSMYCVTALQNPRFWINLLEKKIEEAIITL